PGGQPGRLVGSSPDASSWANWPSSRIGTPASVALVSLAAPGSAPTTTAVVFLDTLPGALPPRSLIASSAASRDQPSRVPVTTMDIPASTWGNDGADGPAKLTPAAR